MAPRVYWKGYLRLSLVFCPIQLFPATSEREKIRFHQLNKETGNRVRYRKIDEETGDEVEQSDIMGRLDHGASVSRRLLQLGKQGGEHYHDLAKGALKLPETYLQG